MTNAASAATWARSILERTEPRWTHVQGVVAIAERIVALTPGLSDAVLDAAWLHDVGYGGTVVRTGFHALDGARYLAAEGWPSDVISLVAYHTGAEFEAEERGLSNELKELPRPDPAELDALILADLSVSPLGLQVHPRKRIDEILTRYEQDDPVHRAVSRSQGYLMECAGRAAAATGSPHEWGFAVA